LQVEPSATAESRLPVAWRVNDAHNLLSVLFRRIIHKLNRKMTTTARMMCIP
jgi:hypothetical protein